jgi:hypothetical protein
VSPRTRLGYQLVAAGVPVVARRIDRQAYLQSPAALPAGGRRYLRPQLAVVLGDDVPPGAGPGAVELSIAGVCLALEILDEHHALVGTVLDDRLLDPESDGPLSLYGDGVVCVTEPAGASERARQVGALAKTVAGLAAGELVFTVADRADDPVPAAAGAWQICAPAAAVMFARITS